jgi:hypothetical protein
VQQNPKSGLVKFMDLSAGDSFDRRSEKAVVGICMVGDDEQGGIRASREDNGNVWSIGSVIHGNG